MRSAVISGISRRFHLLSQSSGWVSHVLRTRSPLDLHECCHALDLVRLACVKHAASVRPEPGSNSPLKSRPSSLGKLSDQSLKDRHQGDHSPTAVPVQCSCSHRGGLPSARNCLVETLRRARPRGPDRWKRPHWRSVLSSVVKERLSLDRHTVGLTGGAGSASPRPARALRGE